MTYTHFLLNNLRAIVDKKAVSYHTPGHKNGRLAPEALKNLWGQSFWQYDLTEIDSLDNLHFASGCIRESQRQAAAIWHVKETYYLINGTTVGLQAAIMACCRGQKVFVPRHVHRSIYHSLILAQAEPIYLPIALDDELSLPLGVAAETLADYIRRYPEVKTLLMVNPTYQGLTWENEKLIKLAKASGLTVIVDEAHGAHLHFSPQLPMSMLDLGADLVVQSWHKMLPVMTQGSVLHAGYDYQGVELAPILSLLQSTSPSYLLMASLEAGSIFMGQEGAEMIAQSLHELTVFFQKLACLNTIKRFYRSEYGQDPFKLYLVSSKYSGAELAELLRERFRIYVEMNDSVGVLLILPLKVNQDELESLYAALVAIDEASSLLADVALSPTFYSRSIPQQAVSLAEAFYRTKQFLPIQSAVGKVCGQFLLKYPPGIPLAVPGERIDDNILALWLANEGKSSDMIQVLV